MNFELSKQGNQAHRCFGISKLLSRAHSFTSKPEDREPEVGSVNGILMAESIWIKPKITQQSHFVNEICQK